MRPPRLDETQSNGGVCVGLGLQRRVVFGFGEYLVIVSESSSLTKYISLRTSRACPSSFLTTMIAALATWSVAAT